MNTTTTTKTHDGKAARETFAAYFRSHQGAPLRSIASATERRRTAACAAMGIELAEYNRRAEAFVEALLVKYPGLAAKPFARTLAFAYVAPVALFRAERAAKAAAEAPPAPVAPVAPLPVVQVIAPKPANDVAAPPPPAAPAARPRRARAEGAPVPSARWPGRDDYPAFACGG
jgi:hypothetical protein